MPNWLSHSLLSLGVAIGLGAPQMAQAAPPTIYDFAFTAELSEGKTSLRQFDLPIEVYAKMFRKDYGDLRIFSAEGQIVPHQISRTETLLSTQIANLVFYPFNKEQASEDGNISIEINQNTGKQQLKINQSMLKKESSSSEYQYIIENTQAQNSANTASQKNTPALCKMKLYWQQKKPSLILGLQLESSDNLQQWQSLSRTLNVSRLNYANSQLVRDEIEFKCTSEPYLRLTWLNQNNNQEAGVSLTSIQGFYTQQNAQQSQWQSFAKPQYNDDGHWLFESNVIAHLIKMEFIAPQNGLLYKGNLFSRNNNDQDWRFRKQVTQYRLNLGDSELESNPFSLNGINDRYWKFEPSIETQFTEDQLPEIKAAWQTNNIVFLAQGSSPFTLAFGNPNISPTTNSDLNNLIKTLQQSSSTVDAVSLKQIIAGEKSFSRDGKINWKKIALWIVLLLGTMLMAFMAYRLFQQMGDEEVKQK